MDDITKKEFFDKLDELGKAKIVSRLDSWKGEEHEAALEWIVDNGEKQKIREEDRKRWDSVRSWISLSISFIALVISGLVAYYK